MLDRKSLYVALGISGEREAAIRSEWINNSASNPVEDLLWITDNPGYTLSEKVYLAAIFGDYIGGWP